MPSNLEPTAFQTVPSQDQSAFLCTQGGDPCARNAYSPIVKYQTIYYTRRLEGFLSCTFHNPPLSGVTYWALDDNAWVGWLHLRSDGSSKIYLAFTGTALKSGGGTDNPSCTNDDVEADAPSMTLDNEPSLGSGLYYSSMDELDTALQGVSGGSPVWSAYTVSNALDVAGAFGPALDADISNVMSSADPWIHIGSDSAAYFSLNVFGNVNTGSWSPDPSGDTYDDLTAADFDGSVILTDPTAGGGPLSDYIISGGVSRYINSSANLPVGVGGAVPYSGITGDLPHANGDWGSQFITRTTRFWVTREYIVVTYIGSSGSGVIAASLGATEYSAPAAPGWVVVPCPSLASGISALCGYIDDTNNGALVGATSGSSDTPNGIFARLLQGWTVAAWTAAGKPLTDAP
jgi:hypothetical protein